MLVVTEKEGFNRFHNITLCPYDKNLLDFSLLTAGDREYINEYHKRVWTELSPKLFGEESVLAWLKEATSPLP
jgi:Xaa-Pro aminopeptidase